MSYAPFMGVWRLSRELISPEFPIEWYRKWYDRFTPSPASCHLTPSIRSIPHRLIGCIGQFVQLTQFVFIYYAQPPERLCVSGQFAMPVIGGTFPTGFMLQMVVPDLQFPRFDFHHPFPCR